MSNTLINKYNVAGPRYTSYPTVPYWDTDRFSATAWETTLLKTLEENGSQTGISLYIHLPFCESLCTFCGCNKRITKQHHVEKPYIEALLKEWRMYVTRFGTAPQIKAIHLGGGTPTFFSPKHLEMLIDGIFKHASRTENYEFSFEGHPNNTTETHLKTLYQLGFKRVSYGVQDYNTTVQRAIHRMQPFEHVKRVTDMAKTIGYTSVGHDIIFGLPFQTIAHVEDTILKTKALLPSRLAFYSYAHVPWIKGNGQRGFKDADLPSPTTKRQQYELGKTLLGEVGYQEIGMDHFALPSDTLYQAMTAGTLHRNFMGYTESKTQIMVGLGVSAIGDSWYGFSQNEKHLEAYYKALEQDQLPVFRGHILTPKDLIIRKHILNLMCRLETSWAAPELIFEECPEVLSKLQEMEADALIEITDKSLRITEKGRPFVRNICMAFDLRLQKKMPETKLFSMTV